MASCRAVGGSAESAIDAACGLEMIHVFSLIHDDLPSIDDDALRRGMPTCHVQFGEALAILAGDALFALGFECLAHTAADPSRLNQAILALARASGSGGLVGGEVIDVESEGRAVNPITLELIHSRKTGALLAASCEIGALIGCADPATVRTLHEFGMLVGLAFQITDDVLNETADEQSLGKAAGSDRQRGKATYPSVFGLDESKHRAIQLVEAANAMHFGAKIDASELVLLSRYAIERIH